MTLDWQKIDPVIRGALVEDLDTKGDVTTEGVIPDHWAGVGTLISRARGVICGLPVAERVFRMIDKDLRFHMQVDEGILVENGVVLASVEGKLAGILKGERTALNFLQRLSGIATLTRSYVSAVAGTRTTVLDTRKTTPMLRYLEKYAVIRGGGMNHRFGLYDMVLIKDNHIDAAGGISQAIDKILAAQQEIKEKMFIEVETRTLDDVREALQKPVQRIMFDNMDTETMRQAVKLVNGRMETEASGNITMGNAGEMARTGVDFISVGALTHSPPALDISLNIIRK